MLYIGDDRQEATDWVQDNLILTRPDAERTMISMLKEGVAVTTDEGVFLLEEEEEEAKKQAKRFSQRISYRKTNRARTRTNVSNKINKRTSRVIKTDFSDVADSLMNQEDEEEK